MEDFFMTTKVLSVGGSIIAPHTPDAKFLSEFGAMVTDWLLSKKDARLILVAGGGGPARMYQNAYRDVAKTFTAAQKKAAGFADEAATNNACDWLGIIAARR